MVSTEEFNKLTNIQKLAQENNLQESQTFSLLGKGGFSHVVLNNQTKTVLKIFKQKKLKKQRHLKTIFKEFL